MQGFCPTKTDLVVMSEGAFVSRASVSGAFVQEAYVHFQN